MEDFGDYTLQFRLARGGMAEIFRARHKATGASVVVKRLLPELETRPEIVDSFLTEADVGQMLRHENIVSVIDAGERDGRYYLVMEFVDGLDLHAVLQHCATRATPLPLPLAMRIALDALRGLHAAHELKGPKGRPFGLVHRDVSPDNLVINKAGVTKVVDFGVARLADLEAGPMNGVIKGKLAYMSPDQVRGLKLDRRADEFALALIVYEMVSGARPFAPQSGESDNHALERVRQARIPSLASVAPAVPRGIARVVDRALRSWRWTRFKSCGAFAASLAAEATEANVLASREALAAYVQQVLGAA